MSDAGVEVVAKALDDGGQLTVTRGDEFVTEDGREGWRRRLIAPMGAERDLRPLALGRLAPQIAHPMDETALLRTASLMSSLRASLSATP